jgi:DNA-binding transcriptional LysR family regulator
MKPRVRVGSSSCQFARTTLLKCRTWESDAPNRSSGVEALPVKIPGTQRQTGVVTPRNRMLSPLAQRFIETAREVTKPLASVKR